jgi:sugar phosphate isomerase/epimerase
MVEDGIAAMLPYAAERGIQVGIEPLHPMFAADRSVIVTLEQANNIVQKLGAANLGVIVDVYHVWWDPNVYREIARAAGHIWGFHINDWLVETPDILMGRGMVGDGVIDLRRLREAVEKAGYTGYIEVEIFNHDIWNTPGDEILAQLQERFAQYV